MKHAWKRTAAAVLLGSGFLLSSCTTPFQARVVDLEKRSEQGSQSYYRFSAGGGENLSFESRNFLSSNLLMRCSSIPIS
ncbi:MAG: hypothetical protein J5944_14740 [Lentisphaeria bacterium]|nr:hypothetical protein [Lentisphaeria bacterium]